MSNAIGLGQGGSSVVESILLRQVQNYVIHGTVGYNLSLGGFF